MGIAGFPFDLDVAKFVTPTIRPATVVKSAVIESLQAASAPFATVVAPAGYGKTTLLARWAETDPRPFAWVSLDQRDDDSLVFLRDIAAAIHRVEAMPPSVFDSLAGPGDTIWNRVPHIGNALAAVDRPLVVALDDLHTVTNPSCQNVLAALFDYVPPKSQIAVTSREQPPLPLARWRAQGMLHEVRTEDMRLDHREADLLMRGAGVVLEPEQIAALTDRTEGWPAGLYLAALSHRTGARDVWRAEGFSGDDRFVSDYFRLEILSRLSDDEAHFLVHSSVLDNMSGPLCDAVLEIHNSARMLESLERSNHFVIPLDHRGEWYRYHHLFRQLLRTELQRSDPDTARVLNRRAMEWCLASGHPEAAVRYGRAAGETEAIAILIDRLALPTYYDGRMETLDDWIGWFDSGSLARFPAIAVYGAWVKALTGQASEAERLLSIAAGSASTVPLSDGSASIEPWVATLRASMMPSGLDQALADANVAIERLAPSSGFRSDALLARGIVHILRGSDEMARLDLDSALEAAQILGAVDVLFVAHAEYALLDAQRGAWMDATRHADTARDIVEEAGLGQYALTALVQVAVARVALHQRRTVDARAAMTRAHRLRPMLDHGLPWLTVHVGNELARAHLALGEPDAARSVIGDTVAVLGRRADLGTLGAETRRLEDQAVGSGSADTWAVNLTAAELRLLPYLATHLTVPEIAPRLFVSTHTVKSQAKSIYQKLDAASRGEAVERAVEVGLLEPMFPHRTNVAN